VTYRWHTRFLGLRDYRFTRSLPSPLVGVMVPEPTGWWERANAAFLRGFLRTCFRSVIGPPFGAVAQRRVVSALSLLMPGVGGVTRRRELINGVPTEVVSPRGHEKPAGVILYLHGGAFCLGGPTSHRSITTRLAVDSGLAVWVPDYRLSPEHPYPAALDDALRSYGALREQGYAPGQIVVAGDSAGGALALALGMSLRDRGEPVPASLLLISPVTDATLVGESMKTRIGHDPMIRLGWVQQGLAWYNCPAEARAHRPLEVDLKGLPPMLIQVGDQEILLSDATRLALHAAHCGVPCRLEVHGGRWHVFHLQSLYLHSARAAVGALAGFARETVAAPAQTLTLA
jgi:acetyl esterase/lipase